MPLYNPTSFSGSFEYSRNSLATTYQAVNASSETKEITDISLSVDLEIPANSDRVGLSFWMPSVNDGFWDSANTEFVIVDENSYAHLHLGDTASVETDLADAPFKGRWMKLTPGSYFEPLVCPTNAICIIAFSDSTTNGSLVEVTEYTKV